MGSKWFLLLSLFFFSFCIASCLSNDNNDASFYNVINQKVPKGVDKPILIKMVNDQDHRLDDSKLTSIGVNVDDYGAKGDGSDATKAFQSAWSKVCSSTAPATLVVPSEKTYLLKPITFSGPCKSNVTVTIRGTILAPTDRSIWGKNTMHWILFEGVNNLYVGGGGTINGNGQIWWKNSCKVDKSKPCTVAPTAITFYSSKNLQIASLNIKNSQQIHLLIENCSNVNASNIAITAPESSPNTDGIHITSTQNIVLDHCNIATGDDCISIVDGAHGVIATNIICGPGHGISIGSLGANRQANYVSNVTIDTAQLKGTTNGLRIKTWQGGSGYATNIKFQNININNVNNPIIIDQYYCDSNEPCQQQKSAVKISDISYINVKGTSASDIAMAFECSKNVPCQRILLQDINLVKAGGGSTKSKCEYVSLTKIGKIIPSPCT